MNLNFRKLHILDYLTYKNESNLYFALILRSDYSWMANKLLKLKADNFPTVGNGRT